VAAADPFGQGIGDVAMIEGPVDPTAKLALGDPLGQGINRDRRKGMARVCRLGKRLPLGSLDRRTVRRPLDGARRDDALPGAHRRARGTPSSFSPVKPDESNAPALVAEHRFEHSEARTPTGPALCPLDDADPRSPLPVLDRKSVV